MVQASATVAYVAAAANRFPYTADISPESLVAFGSHKSVSLWNLPDERIHATLPGHEGVVTCLRFVSKGLFVSGDDNGVLRCWEKSGSQVTRTNIDLNLHNISSFILPFLVARKTKNTGAREADILHGLPRRLPHHRLIRLDCKGLDCGSQRWCRHANRIFFTTPVC